MLKRILAVIGLIVILGWIIATLALAVLPIPMKTVLFPIFAAGCVILPILQIHNHCQLCRKYQFQQCFSNSNI